MTGAIYPDVLPENYAANLIAIKNLGVPAGTFSLRRTHYLNEIEQELLLNAELRLTLRSLIQADDFDAKQKVIAHHLHLVADMAMRYANRGVEFLDLVREGTIGLICALNNFELESGFRFAVYARLCICENIERAIMNRSNSQFIGTC